MSARPFLSIPPPARSALLGPDDYKFARILENVPDLPFDLNAREKRTKCTAPSAFVASSIMRENQPDAPQFAIEVMLGCSRY
jgi:hypothetical protein